MTVEESNITIVGIGPGSRDYMLKKAVDTLSSSDYIIGFKRAILSISFIPVKKQIVNSLKEIIAFIEENKNIKISVVASGDPMFYGVASYLSNKLKEAVEVVPGISSFQYMMSKLKKPWQSAELKSVHGREEKLIEVVKGSRVSIWLTDNKNTPDFICRELVSKGIEAKVYIGENLSYEDENIFIGRAEEFVNKKFQDLTVVVIENVNKG